MKLLLITITIFLYITQAKKPHKFSFFRFLQVQNLFSQNEEPEIQSQKNSSSDSSNNSANILKEGWLRISSLSLYVK